MTTERSLRLTFSYDAWESWRDVVNELGSMFVRVSPVGGGKPFDAYLVRVNDEPGQIGEIQIIRGTPSSLGAGPVETVAIDKLHVY